MTKQQSFITGAVILTVTSLFVRAAGFLFRIYLSNMVGAEGMGIYSLIMSVYGLCTTVATSGVSIAVSRLVAEQLSLGRSANAVRVLRRSVSLSLLLGCAIGTVLLIVSEPIAMHVLGDERTLLSLRILAPGLPFLAISSCFRGYFVAHRKTANPASGQVVEQMFKIGFVVLMIGRVIPYGLEYAAAWIVLGLTLGEIVCFIYTFAGYMLIKNREQIAGRADMQNVVRKILEIILPISVAAYIRSALRLAENVITLNALRLYSGAGDIAISTYGMLKGMAMPLLLFPLSLLSSFVITLTPEISRLHVSGRKRELEAIIGRILQYTCFAGVMIVCVFMTFPREIGIAVYNDPGVGEMLLMLSFLSPFMCLELVTVGILQGLGEQVSSTRYNIIDCALRIGLVWALIPLIGVAGFMWMTVASNLFTSILNIRRLVKITKVRFEIKQWLIKPGIAAVASGQITLFLYRHGALSSYAPRVSLFIGIAMACAAYIVLLFLLDCIKSGDISWIFERLRRGAAESKKAQAEVVQE